MGKPAESNANTLVSVLRIFFGAKNTNPWTVLLLLLLAGLFEGVGLASLLPLLTSSIGDDDGGTSFVDEIVRDGLAVLGLAPTLPTLLMFVIGGITLKCVLKMAAMHHVGVAMAEVATGLRVELVKQLLNVKWEYFTREPIGRIANAVSVDATRSGQAYLAVANFTTLSIQSMVYTVVALMVSWKLAMAALVVGAAIAAALHALVRISKKAGRRQTEKTSELVTYLSDAMSNIKPLKAMAAQRNFARLFDKKVQQLNRALRRQVVSQYALKNLEEILVAVCLGCGFYATTIFMDVPVLQLLVMGLLMFQTVSSVGKIQRYYQKAVLLESPYWATRDLIRSAASAREPDGGKREPSFERGCQFDEVALSIGDKRVLQAVSLEIPAGQLTVVTGASGAGKTTLTDLLLGLFQPIDGRILIDGVPLSDIDLKRWRRMVGFVPQELILFHDSIFANVTLGNPELDEDDAHRALQVAGAWDFVAALPDGMQSQVGEKGTFLSGGQRQRIALARALATSPKLLILDEVTSALDPDTEQDICRSIASLVGDMTVIAITHSEAWNTVADRVYRVEGHTTRLIKNGGSSLRRQTAAGAGPA